ncbi:MAG: hypothetical protein SGJ18_09730 [Pseudomonadota bacterium]|nr:hypothetical protein [Pseudomonadota bacterium]
MGKVTFIVTLFIFFAWEREASASQAFLSGTEIVIDLKKMEIPQLKELISAAQQKTTNRYYSIELTKELLLNGQKIKVYYLKKRSLWLRFKFPLPWVVSVNENDKVIEINGAALIDGELKRVDFILDN